MKQSASKQCVVCSHKVRHRAGGTWWLEVGAMFQLVAQFWCCCSFFSIQDHTAAAIAKAITSSVCAWKVESDGDGEVLMIITYALIQTCENCPPSTLLRWTRLETLTQQTRLAQHMEPATMMGSAPVISNRSTARESVLRRKKQLFA